MTQTLKDPNPQGSFVIPRPHWTFLGFPDALQHPHGYVQDLTVIDGLKPDFECPGTLNPKFFERQK
jgi:hypothetical protein